MLEYFLISNYDNIHKVLQFCINPFHATGLFLYPLKALENLRFPDIFGGYKKQTNGMKWVKNVVTFNVKI